MDKRKVQFGKGDRQAAKKPKAGDGTSKAARALKRIALMDRFTKYKKQHFEKISNSQEVSPRKRGGLINLVSGYRNLVNDRKRTGPIQLAVMQVGEGGASRWLVNPYGTFKKVWETFKFVLLLYVFAYLPLNVTFVDQPVSYFSFYYLFDKFIDLTFFIDLFLNFFTPVLDKFDIAATHKRIAQIYLSGWFTLDVVALLPIEEIATAFLQDDSYNIKKVVKLLKIIRLFRLLKLLRLIKSFDFKNQDNYIISLIMYLTKGTPLSMVLPNFVLIIIAAHVCACLWYFVGNTLGSDTNQGWVYLDNYADESDANSFVRSFYFVIETFTTCGYGDISSNLLNEYALRMFYMFFGVLMYSTFSGMLVEYRGTKVEESELYVKRREALDRVQKVFPLLEHHYLIILEELYDQKNNESTVYDYQNLSPEELDNLEYNRLLGKFAKVKLFSEDPQYSRFVLKLGRLLKRKEFLEGQKIFRRGEPSVMFCIIYKGSVCIESTFDDELPFMRIKEGFFGEYEVLHKLNREFTYAAETDCTVYYLFTDEFRGIFIDSINDEEREFAENFMRQANERQQKFREANLQLQDKFAELMTKKLGRVAEGVEDDVRDVKEEQQHVPIVRLLRRLNRAKRKTLIMPSPSSPLHHGSSSRLPLMANY